MKLKRQPTPLQKKARKGFRGYPVATIAYYGPDDKHASKVAVGIVQHEKGEVTVLERWFSEGEARCDAATNNEILAFISRHEVRSIVISDRIIGCPHEEGIDYPEGQPCPQCPFWNGRDRWAGQYMN